MVDSAVQRHANHTVQCPVFLADDLGRMNFPATLCQATCEVAPAAHAGDTASAHATQDCQLFGWFDLMPHL